VLVGLAALALLGGTRLAALARRWVR
jgi:hypothetical protein